MGAFKRIATAAGEYGWLEDYAVELAKRARETRSRPGDWLDRYVAEQADVAAVIWAAPEIDGYSEADEVADAQAERPESAE
jgi:hypothetical protein